MLLLAFAVSLSAQTPVGGVKITTSDGQAVYTDSQGYYTITVPYGWNGTVTPSAAGYTFNPTSVSLSNLIADTVANITASLAPVADTQAPVISITYPRSGSTVARSVQTVTLTASVSDNTGVAGVQWALDGVRLGSEVTRTPFSCVLSTSASRDKGWHTLTAKARDAAGNTSVSAPVKFRIR